MGIPGEADLFTVFLVARPLFQVVLNWLDREIAGGCKIQALD